MQGNDNLFGCGGADRIDGGTENDVIEGGDGNDILDGAQGDDTIDGQDDDDTIDGGVGNDILDGGTGDDDIAGGNDVDTIDGGEGDDTINGGEGNDDIVGGNGNDNIRGGNGNDEINGGEGDDEIRGENGDDTLTGGEGADSFRCDNGNDTVTDFNADEGDTLVTNHLCENVITVVTPDPPTIDQPETITDCDNPFDITGNADTATETIDLYIKDGEILTLIGSTSDIDDETGQWIISVDPNDPNLGDGTFTLVAIAMIGEEESGESNEVTVTIDCPLPTPTIDTPEVSLITDCENDFTVTGNFEGGSSGATEVLILYRQGDPNTEVGRTTEFGEGGSWSITLNPTVVGEGELILVAQGYKMKGKIMKKHPFCLNP